MTDKRMKQIETLGTKLMGWIPYEVMDYLDHWEQVDGSGFAAPPTWNPFESPADCEMLKAKIIDMERVIIVARQKDRVKVQIVNKDGYGPDNWHFCTEYEAVCLAALRLVKNLEN